MKKSRFVLQTETPSNLLLKFYLLTFMNEPFVLPVEFLKLTPGNHFDGHKMIMPTHPLLKLLT